MPPRKNQKSAQQVIPEYFKDNIQDPADEDFDPSQYYYKRPERSAADNQLAASQDPQLNFVTSGVSTLPGEDDILQQGFTNPLTGVPQRFPSSVTGINLGTAVVGQISRQPTPSSIIPNSIATGSNPRNILSMASQGNISPPLAQTFGSSALGSNQIQTPTTPTRPSPMRPGSANSNIISQQPVQLTSPLRAPSNMGNTANGSSILGLLNNTAMQQQMGAEYIPSNTILAMINKGPQQPMGGSLLSAGNGLDNKFGSQQPFQQSQYQSLYRSQDMDLLSMPGGQSATTKQYPTGKTDDRYGLMGLLGVIKMVNPDLNTLSLGLDLTTLGLNLNSSEYLYTTFAAPWSDSPSRVVPEFKIPQCYQLPQQLPLKNAHFQKFQDETLFYIFYSMPKDVLQIVAAKELCARRWRYHKELKIWFKKDPDTQPQQQQAFERGPFVYFDVGLWSKCITKADFIIKREDTMTI